MNLVMNANNTSKDKAAVSKPLKLNMHLQYVCKQPETNYQFY